MTKYLAKYGKITGYGSPLWEPGLDVDLRTGDPVYSPKNGKVVYAGQKGGFGNQVVVKTATGTEVMLSHLDSIDVKVGDIVKRNQIVGKGGNTGSTIPVGGGDGSHLDITVKDPKKGLLKAKEVEDYVNKVDYSKMADGIIKARNKGLTDTEILESLKSLYPEFAEPINKSRARYSVDKSLKNDRDLTNFLAKKFSGIENLPVASNPLPNAFKQSGYEKEQVLKMAKSFNIDEGMVSKLYDNGEIDRFNELMKAEGEAMDAQEKSKISSVVLESAPVKAINWTIDKIGDVVEGNFGANRFGKWISKKIGTDSTAVKVIEKSVDINEKYLNLPAATKMVGNVFGAGLGMLSGIVMEGIKSTADLMENAPLSKPEESQKRVEESTKKGSELVGEFGKEVGRGAPLTYVGKIPNAILSVPIAVQTIYDLGEVDEQGWKPVFGDLGLLAMSVWGTRATKGKWIDKDMINLTKEGLEKIGSKAKEYAQIEITPSSISSIIKNKNKAVEEIKYNADKVFRPSTTEFKTPKQRDLFYAKTVNGITRLTENKANFKFTDEAGNTVVRLPENLEEAVSVVSSEKGNVYKLYDNAQKETGKMIEIKTDEIVNELRKVAENESIIVHSPKTALYAEEMANKLEGKKWTTEETQENIKILNERNQAFYKRGGSTFDDLSTNYIDETVNKFYRQKLDEVIGSETGTAYQDLKNYYGQLSEIERRMQKRLNLEKNKAVKGLLDYTDLFSSGQLINGLINLNPGQVGAAMTTNSLKNWFKKINSPDNQIKQMFKSSESFNKNIEEIAGRMKKVYSDSLSEALKNQSMIGGEIKKGFYVPSAKTRKEALAGAEIASEQLNIGRIDENLGYSLHSWVEKNGKVFDTFYDDGFVESRLNYVSEADLYSYVEHKVKYGELLALPSPSQIELPDKYANQPNLGSKLYSQDEAIEHLQKMIKPETDSSKLLPEKVSSARPGVIEMTRRSQSAVDAEEIARMQDQIKKAKTPAQKQELLSAVGGAYGIEVEKDENGNIIGFKFDPEKAVLGMGLSVAAVKAGKIKTGALLGGTAAMSAAEAAYSSTKVKSAGGDEEEGSKQKEAQQNVTEIKIKDGKIISERTISEKEYKELISKPKQPEKKEIKIEETSKGGLKVDSVIEDYVKKIKVVIDETGQLKKWGNTLAIENNNPGNLLFAGQPNATKGRNGFAKFPTPEIGFRALVKDIQSKQSKGLTLEEMMNIYSPPKENNTELYIKTLSDWLGIKRNEKVDKVDTIELAKKIALFESQTKIKEGN